MDKVVHFEIPADDMERAQKFYEAVFGWKIDFVPEFKYAMVATVERDSKTQMPKEPGAINGGIMQRDQIKNPVVTIAVKDVDAALEKLEKAGGKTVMPGFKVGDMGIAAYFQDTEGNVMGLWQQLK
ncbi:VOC family protein [Candidatus Woesearchaeota archaeon]|nr:VOC family protein [Candidatus Woesearchaeota archaeon]